MRVEAKWENGAFHPIHPIKLKNERVTIIVPDEEIEDDHMSISPEIDIDGQKLLKKFEIIRNSPVPPADELPAWTEKNQERLDAVEIHRQLRREKGRII